MNPQRYCKECKIPINKGKQYCVDHQHIWDRPSFKELECNQCNVTKPKHHFNRRNNTCKICTNLAGLNGKEFNSTSLISQLLGKNAQKVFTRHKSFTKHNNQQKVKLPNHIKEKKLRLKEVRELKIKHQKELRWAEYLVKTKDVHINKTKKGIQNRKKELDVMLGDLVDYMMKGLPTSDFKNKKDWTQSITQMETIISKYLNVPISVVREKRKGKYRTEPMWINYINGEIKKIQPNYTGTAPWIYCCVECGKEEEKPDRSSLVRVLGLGGNDDKKNGGMCYDCSMTEKRTPHGSRTPEQVEKMRETAILNQTEYDSVEEWAKAKRKKRDWYDICGRMSKQNLRKYKPDEYKRLINNTWDGTNFETGLTIEHIKPKSVCYKENKLLECAHSDNLKVVTMRENNQLWNEYVNKKIH